MSIAPPDGQKRIRWICVCEYLHIEQDEERFRQALRPFLPESESLPEVIGGEMHPRERDVGTETAVSIELPDNPKSPFTEVLGVVTADTNHLARFSLCGKVDTAIIGLEREAAIEAMDEHEEFSVETDRETPSDVQNIDEKLEIAEEIFDRGKNELCAFLRDQVGVGVISSGDADWLDDRTQRYPYLYHYDFADDDLSVTNVEQLGDTFAPAAYGIRIGAGSLPGQIPTPLPDSSNVICGRGEDIIHTPLGRIPIGFASMHLANTDELNRTQRTPPSRAFLGTPDLPHHAYTAIQTVSAVAAGVYWSLHTYQRIQSLAPDATPGLSENVNKTVEQRSDTELSALLSELYNRQHDLETLQQTFDAEFLSLDRVTETYAGQLDAESAVSPLLTATEEFTTVCENRAAQYIHQYDRYIKRIRDEVDVSVGVVGKRLSYAIFALTVINILVQIPGLLRGPSDGFLRLLGWVVLGLSLLILGGMIILIKRQ